MTSPATKAVDRAVMEEVIRTGSATIPALLSGPEVQEARQTLLAAIASSSQDGSILRRGATVYAIRNLARVWPASVKLLERSRLLEPLRELLGEKFGVVRSMLVDKPPRAGWSLPWHKDTTVAVRDWIGPPPPGFLKLTRKAGVLHVQPPDEVLESMLVVRLELDDVTLDNGPLWLVADSHRSGTRLEFPDGLETVGVPMLASAGDALIYRFLTAHRSTSSAGQASRRTLHFECAPAGAARRRFEWETFVTI